MNCSRCGKEMVSTGLGMGYGTNEDNKIHCYACCAELDQEYMNTHDKITLYLSAKKGQWEVTNWPRTLKFKAVTQLGKHNIARIRYDAWFKDKLGQYWHGVLYGQMTQLIHCKKLKHHPWCKMILDRKELENA